MAPPLIDTFIVPKVPGVLYALFDYGLTFKRPRNCSFFSTFLASSSVIPIMGIMVTNAIVLVDRVLKNEENGLSTLEAGSTRLRPILMTALSMISALIPLAIGTEGSDLISQGVGITVMDGLVSFTLLTLLIVPVVYEVIMKLGKREKAVKTKKETSFPVPLRFIEHLVFSKGLIYCVFQVQ